MKDHYSIFGIQSTATMAEITSAYKKRVKVVHPDRFDARINPDEWHQANSMLQELNDAYADLKKKHTDSYEQNHSEQSSESDSRSKSSNHDDTVFENTKQQSNTSDGTGGKSEYAKDNAERTTGYRVIRNNIVKGLFLVSMCLIRKGTWAIAIGLLFFTLVLCCMPINEE